MIPLQWRQSMAWAMSNAKLTAQRKSNRLGRRLAMYLRRDLPPRSSVTITITGSLHAPTNFTRFLCSTLHSMATSRANRDSILAVSSTVSGGCRIFTATFWSKYLPS
ncbi:hypothetical protein Mapa_006934 [Marchantia paleacea]|nr:hypothetical protein Mapa_006934 [Marchantia paleacea]